MRHISTRNVLIVGALGLMGCGATRGRSSQTPLPAAPKHTFEQNFLQNRVAHQQAAIEMAGTCVQKAQQSELKAFCGEFLVRERSELDQMKVWYRAWYPASASLPPANEKMTQGYQNFLGAIRSKSGPAFDEALLRGIRLHHSEGLSESAACTGGSVHDELKLYCQNARSEQEREIKQMNGWVCQWFKDCIAR